MVGSTRQLELGADRARQRFDMEMLGGTTVVNAVGAAGAMPGGEDEVGAGADAKTGVDAGAGLGAWDADAQTRWGGSDWDGGHG